MACPTGIEPVTLSFEGRSTMQPEQIVLDVLVRYFLRNILAKNNPKMPTNHPYERKIFRVRVRRDAFIVRRK